MINNIFGYTFPKKSTANQKSHTDIRVRNIMSDIQRKRLFPGQKHQIVFA